MLKRSAPPAAYPAPMLAAASLLLLLLPQGPAPAKLAAATDIEARIARLRQAHCGGKPPDVADYLAEIEIRALDPEQDSHAVRFHVRYLRAQRLLRYGTEQGGRKIERGRDAIGPWQRGDKGPVSLREPDRALDHREFMQHLRLAERLLRYLDPGAIVAELQQPTIRRVELPLGGDKSVACERIEGTHPSLPLYFQRPSAETFEGPVRVQLWIDVERDRLLRMQSTPLDDDGRPLGFDEIVQIGDWAKQGDLLIPRTLRFVAKAAEPQQAPAPVAVDVHKLVLDSGAKPEDFDRHKLP
jgi:hypothetical protein